MTHLSSEDLATLAQRLDSMKAAALRDLQETSAPHEHDSLGGSNEVHSNADDSEARRIDQLHEAEIGVDAMRLHDVVRAQQRMAEGSYGKCIDCGKGISLARLGAQPIAIRCAKCQSEAERLQNT